MKFWQNNRLDGTFEASIEQIVAQFRASTSWTADLDLDSAVRGFLIDADGPVSAVWDDETDLAEVCGPGAGRRLDRGSRRHASGRRLTARGPPTGCRAHRAKQRRTLFVGNVAA